MKNFWNKRTRERLIAQWGPIVDCYKAGAKLFNLGFESGVSRRAALLSILASISAGYLFLGESQKSREGEAIHKPVLAVSFDAAPQHPETKTPVYSSEEKIQSLSETEEDDRAVAFETLQGTLGSGDTLGLVLNRRGVTSRLIHDITSQMRPLFDFRQARPGDKYYLDLREDGRILRFRYVRSPFEEYMLEVDGEIVTARRLAPRIDRRRATISGLVSQNLYDSLSDVGGDHSLASDFSEIFAWDLDFSRSVRMGDRFAILYERLYNLREGRPETYIGSGKILAASYLGNGAALQALYFENEAGRGGYYRPDGSAMQRQFLKAPLEYRRISSSYSLSRLHPILKVRRPHRGIDYAAPAGTPVWAVADGTLTYMGRNGGFGKLVKIRHANGYISYYGHLSRYRKGLRVGSKVSQKEVVGYVGSTGLATGPHLDYRLRKDGKYVDPNKIRIPSGKPISKDKLESFGLHRDQVLSELKTAKSAGSL